MPTLGLSEAAAYLHLSPVVVRRRAAAGVIPAAKPGKAWVFLEDDLAAYLRALYRARGQAPLSGSKQETGAWQSSYAAECGGSTSSPRTAHEYESLLGLRTRGPRRNCTTR
ncbi:MAG: DNA-binding protein [Xanthomonadaceae bacterium]|nr:DNA-binding protein [Xanthomonadaceae bacterium]